MYKTSFHGYMYKNAYVCSFLISDNTFHMSEKLYTKRKAENITYTVIRMYLQT